MRNNSKAGIVLNSVFWGLIIFVLTTSAIFFHKDHTLNEYIIGWGVFGIINLSIFYINYLVLMPELISKNKHYWWYVICVILLLAVSSIVKAVFAALNPEDLLRYYGADGKAKYQKIYWFALNRVFIGGFFLVCSCIIKFAIDWFYGDRARRSLESEKKDMELQFLKSQLNPHFLFNSLNNIYSLAYQKSEKTPDAILKLSEIMRYMIYESNDSWVSLDKEVAYVNSYVELQKLRFKDGAAVEITINGEIDGQKIVPLILISFVENAFKHGVANDATDPIKINIIANQKILHFSVTNKKNVANKDAIGGVGLNNVERRLQLLYPERYKLNVVNTTDHYTTELMLDL